MYHPANHRPGAADDRRGNPRAVRQRDRRYVRDSDQRPHTIAQPAAEMRGARTARPIDRQPQPDAGDDERAQRHAQIREDADRQRRRAAEPGDRDKPREDRFSSDRIDERRQAPDEAAKPKYDRYTGERLEAKAARNNPATAEGEADRDEPRGVEAPPARRGKKPRSSRLRKSWRVLAVWRRRVCITRPSGLAGASTAAATPAAQTAPVILRPCLYQRGTTHRGAASFPLRGSFPDDSLAGQRLKEGGVSPSVGDTAV